MLFEKYFKKFYAERELGFFVGCPKEAVVTIFTDAACFNRSIEFDFFSSKALKKLYIYVIIYIYTIMFEVWNRYEYSH